MNTATIDNLDLRLPETAAIGIFGHYGNENLGDEAIIEAVVTQIRRRLPMARLQGFSINPRDTTERFGLPAYPIRRGLSARRPSEVPPASPAPRAATPPASGWRARLKSVPGLQAGARALRGAIGGLRSLFAECRFLALTFGRVRRLDLLMVTGSNQFLDNFGGPWGFPYTLLKWTLLARLGGTPVVFVSVGAGPLSAASSRRMIRWALRCSAYVSFRDKPSQQMLVDDGFDGPSAVFPDLAFSLPGALGSSSGLPADARPLVGINPMPVYDNRYWCVHDDQLYSRYVDQLAVFAAGLMREGYPLLFWSTQPRDELVVEDVVAALESRAGEPLDREALVRAPRNVAALVETLRELDIAVATRFHGVVLSLWAGLPTVSICYYRKQNDLMQDLGQGEFTLPFENLDSRQLLARFRALEAQMVSARAEIEAGVRAYRNALSSQFDKLFGAAIRSERLSASPAALHGS